jgi:hypothetical protein
MRLIAQPKQWLQDLYPSQAEGGFAGTLSSSMRAALGAWEKKRFGKDYSCSWSKTVSTASGKRRKANKPLTPEQKLAKAAWAKAHPAVGAARARNIRKCREWHVKQKAVRASLS